MMIHPTRLCPVLLVIALLSVCTRAVRAAEFSASDSWQQALESYQQEDYGAAAIHLQKIVKIQNSTWESAARLLLSKCYLQLDLLRQARESAHNLICRFPHGRYAPYAHYLQAQIDFLQENFSGCAWQLLTAAQTSPDPELNLLARSKLERIFEVYLTDEQQQKILAWAKDSEILAELSAAQQGYRLPLKIGVVLPLSGPRAEAGQALLEGIEQACAEAQKRTRLYAEVVSRDSEGSMIEAVRAIQSLIAEENVLAVIGDLEGTCSAALAAVAVERDIPLVIPAAQDVGLISLGKSIYQLMADYECEGQMMGRYARATLHARRVAVLAPACEEGMRRVQGFQSAFPPGEITSLQWYYPETTNFRRLIEALAQVSPRDTTLPTAPVPRDSARGDTLEEAQTIRILPDSTFDQMPINYLQAIYLPIQGEEMALIAPQLKAMGYRGKLLGDSRCLDLVARESNRRYIEGIIFPSQFASNLEVSLNSDFNRTYQSRSGLRPNRWNVLGWDAFNFLASALKDTGKLNRYRVSSRLQGLHQFHAARLDMSFPEGTRMNRSLYLLTYAEGQLSVVKSPKESGSN